MRTRDGGAVAPVLAGGAVTPREVLAEQAAALGPKTGGRVTASVCGYPDDPGAALYLTNRPDYAYRLLSVSPADSYPARLNFGDDWPTVTNEEELRSWLAAAFASSETRRVVQSLAVGP